MAFSEDVPDIAPDPLSRTRIKACYLDTAQHSLQILAGELSFLLGLFQ